MTTASDDEDVHFDDDDDELLAAALETSSKDQLNSGVAHQDAGTSKYSDVREIFDGFDTEAGQSWIYPTNYTLRDYQFSIVQKGLFSNTLVSLPTGLGKTFIAAVVMFNFYRWYPQGKIIFMAPTKPLVAQQIEACFNVMGIPQNHMAEMTGSMKPTERKVQWKMKRMFFLTPQVMTNDISRGNCPAKFVKCLVVDEAHKALGNHPYAVVVKELAKVNRQFRVLALSATPGSDIKAVQQIITNLLISNVEIRMEDSIDIMPYTHGKIIEKIIVPLGDHLESVKTRFMKVIMIYVERLKGRKVLFKCNPENLSKFFLLKERDRFRQNPPENLPRSELGQVEGDFAMSMSLYHAYKLLQIHGLRSFYNFLKGILNGDKGTPHSRNGLRINGDFCQLYDELESSFQVSEINNQPSTSTAMQPAFQCSPRRSLVVSHPKMQKLVEIMLEHFQRNKEESNKQIGHSSEVSTRAMVFSQYRDSVAEITDLLNRHQPLIKAMQFIGQSSGTSSKGLSQKFQLQVVSKFRAGGFNTLVSTCVGEEGLDIGEVDLIVCYDAHKSPIRLVQRIGRTGRKRKGRVIMLITKGKEEHTYNQGQLNKRTIDRTIANGSQVYDLYPMNPRMIPAHIVPVCVKKSVFSGQFKTATEIRQKGNSCQKLRQGDSPYLTEDELNIWNSKFKLPTREITKPPPSMTMLSLKSNIMDHVQERSQDKYLSLTDWLPWQNVQQPTVLVSHTKNSVAFVEMMQTIQVYTQLEDDNNSYGLELAPFFNRQDVEELAVKEVASKSRIYDFFPIVAKPSQSSVVDNRLISPKIVKTPVKLASPRKKHKLQRLLFSTESDDDFCLPSPPQTKSAEKSAKRAKSSTLVDAGIEIINPVTSLQEATDRFFNLPADFSERTNFIEDEGAPRVRLKTPPSSPPHDLVTFRLWLDSFRSSDKVEQVNSPKITEIGKDKAVFGDLFADLDLEEWEEDGCDSIVAQGPQDFAPCSPRKNAVEALRSASTSPVFNSVICKKSTAGNVEADSNLIGQRSMFSVTQLVDMLHTDSFSARNIHSDTQPISPKPKSKYTFKSSSKKVHRVEQHMDEACIPAIDNRLKPFPASSQSAEHLGNSAFRSDGDTESRQDALPHFPKAVQPKGQFDNNNNNRECPTMVVHPFMPSPSPRKASSSDSKARLSGEANSKPISSPVANVLQGDFNESDIIPPSPKQTGMLSKFKYKFKPMFNSVPALHPENSLCLSPIGVAASKDCGRSEMVVRTTAALAASTPANVPTERLTSKMRSSGLQLDDDKDFSQHNQKRKRKLLESPEIGVKPKQRKVSKIIVPRDNAGRQYLEEEAQVCDLDVSLDEDEQIPGIDQYEESFIDDRQHPTQFSQTKQDDTSTMAMYLRTIHSPAARPGAFKLPCRKAPETEAQHGSKDTPNVFSQQPSSDDSDYINDSFCVDNDFVEYAQTPARIATKVKPTTKRKRVYMLDTSTTSSDEEQITDAKSIPDKSCNTVMDVDTPSPGPSTSTAGNVASTHSSHKIVKRTNDPPTSRMMPSKTYDSFDPAPSTSATAGSRVPLRSPGTSKRSAAVVSSSPTSAEMANFRPAILVGSMEMASGQEIISCLNVRHRAKVTIVTLNHCDYIISNRMGVERKVLSDVANSALRRQLLLRIRDMISMFERPCLIVESDRVKPNEKPRSFLRSKYFDNIMACIAQTPVKILFSQSQEETAEILVNLSRREFVKGLAIDVPLEVDERKAKHLKFYSTLPSISHVVCLNFCANYASIVEFLKSSVEEMETKGKVPRSKAELLHKYLHRGVSSNI